MLDDRKASRVLSLYDRLRKDFVLKKEQLATEFGVTPKTVQRDLDEIRAYIADYCIGESVVYDYEQKGYLLKNNSSNTISAVEVFALVKILLESRAFNKVELDRVLEAVCSIVSKPEQHAFRDLVLNEKYHYQPVTHGKPLLSMIWDLGQFIMKKEIIKITYKKMDGEDRERTVYPLAIVFSEFYFYLIAKIDNSEYETPAFYRIDRIAAVKSIGRKFSYQRYEDGELKKRAQFMYGGQLLKLKFKYNGPSLESIMDRFPTAQIIERFEQETVIKAEVFGKGCIMWILSQGEQIELLEPIELREELTKRSVELLNRYVL